MVARGYSYYSDAMFLGLIAGGGQALVGLVAVGIRVLIEYLIKENKEKKQAFQNMI